MRVVSRISDFREHFENWPSVLVNYYLRRRGIIPGGTTNVKLRRGPVMNVRILEGDSSDLLRILQVWDAKIYNVAGFELETNSKVLDIGAHIGSFTLYAATIAQGTKVFSYEPHPDNYHRLVENVRASGCTNVVTHNQAVSDKRSKGRLYVNSSNTGAHTILEDLDKDSVEVELVSIADVFDDNKIDFCNFMKMDCEGAEYPILLNTPTKYLNRIGKIAMEYHESRARKVNELTSRLHGIGFNTLLNEFRPGHSGILYACR